MCWCVCLCLIVWWLVVLFYCFGCCSMRCVCVCEWSRAWIKKKRETGFEPVTLRAAIESSTTELPARRNQTPTLTQQTPL